jgi:NAD(P)-dependent dehydrogenase (short-subunit alcohol dehydrogenase family)
MSQKYAIVTGASSGVGGAIAIELAKSGYFVALVGRNQDKLAKTKVGIEAVGGGSRIFTAGLNTFDGIDKLIEVIKADTKQIDLLVNAAAIWHGDNEVFAGRDFDTFPQSVVSDTIMVGLMAPTLLCHAFIPLMLPKSKIINISGTFEDGGKGWLPYFVSKRGIEDLTVGLADELKDKDIQVNCISPSDTATEVYKKYFPQFAEDANSPEDIADQVIKLCSTESDKITGKVFVIKHGQPVTEKFHS